jgi:hypothetical protein
VERNKVMKEVRNYFQELVKENTIIIEERDLIISYEKDEQTEDPTYIEGK